MVCEFLPGRIERLLLYGKERKTTDNEELGQALKQQLCRFVLLERVP